MTRQTSIDDTHNLPTPSRARWSLRVMIGGLLLLLIWSSVGEIDQVTRAQAQIIAEERTQLVQSSDGGVLTELHVKEGDVVRAGQLLATLQKERAAAAVSDSRAKVAALNITLARLHAEVYGKPLAFDKDLLSYSEYIRNQTDLYNKRRTAFTDDMRALKRILGLAEEELRIHRQLETTNDVSRAEVLRMERGVADIQAQITGKRNKYLQDAQAEMTKAQEDLSTQNEQLRDRIQVLDHTELVAPMDGVVNSIKVTTLGGVVRQGDEILQILPTESDLVVEAKIKPADMANIKPGLLAKVKLDAYDYAIFGTMSGTVTYVSADTLQEDTKAGPMTYYRVKVAITEKDYKKSERVSDIEVRPGMTATVDIQTGKRSVLSYLLKPVSVGKGDIETILVGSGYYTADQINN